MSVTTPKHITDDDLLAMIDNGEIVIVNLDDDHPQLVYRGRNKTAELTIRRGLSNGIGDVDVGRFTWRFDIGSRWTSRRTRRIVCSKLVWMFVHRQLIPAEHKIHHLNEDRHCDAQWNLKPLTDEQHAAAHCNWEPIPE